ncbi:hypothetical protein PULV_a3470 [Pseudoalteromonas ulvae UL12]|uniref:UPF0208 membrane protein YfbV n=1 Tax=Pseudoalteromonas ulvae TaxID=107327 RepID=A0A244CTH7_PSEDV|nr:terminus macrodomain insulation protein YfbV [Pseudoalteromonas ulvae]MBE0363288.1 hypothetical protein [Pseudoalteromonas ulvae UL12]OUL58894.1 hypothetical protein B1199_01010 [Pseudoalteromonas ulvae]
MQKSIMSQLNDGQQYSKIWPNNVALAPIFPERRVIKATQLALKVMPMLAVFSIFVQVQFFGSQFLPQALTFALFLLSMPLQGLYWLGKRANTTLPPSLASWYRELQSKMQENGYQPTVTRAQPRFYELAHLLKEMFEKMDQAFTKEIF